jgi:hypothetical protein
MIAALFLTVAFAADYVSVDAAGKHEKYAGAVVTISDDYPPTLEFVQGAPFAIGSGPLEPPRPGSIPFVLHWHGPHGDALMKCTAPPPAFDGVAFHAHFACEVQP